MKIKNALKIKKMITNWKVVHAYVFSPFAMTLQIKYIWSLPKGLWDTPQTYGRGYSSHIRLKTDLFCLLSKEPSSVECMAQSGPMDKHSKHFGGRPSLGRFVVVPHFFFPQFVIVDGAQWAVQSFRYFLEPNPDLYFSRALSLTCLVRFLVFMVQLALWCCRLWGLSEQLYIYWDHVKLRLHTWATLICWLFDFYR